MHISTYFIYVCMSLLQFSSNSIENAPIFTLILRVTASVYIPGHFVTHTLSHTTHYKGHSPLRRCISTCVLLNKVSFFSHRGSILLISHCSLLILPHENLFSTAAIRTLPFTSSSGLSIRVGSATIEAD